MSQRSAAANTLAVYFENKGHILSHREYKTATDTPIRLARIIQIFGSYNQMENIVRTKNGQGSAERPADTDVEDVIRAQQEARAEYENKMRAASENVDAKYAREKAAADQMERDRLNAKTVDGIIENKTRKGGFTSQDAKAKKEAIEHAVAEEHKILASTAEGAALGKHMLGGVEDNDDKTRVIAEQVANRDARKLKTWHPKGSAEAKLMEADVDGQLSREAEARLRNEMRFFVPPTQDEHVDQAKQDALTRVRPEARPVIEKAAGDEGSNTSSVKKAELAREEERIPRIPTNVPKEALDRIPPADQASDPKVVGVPFTDDKGKPDKDFKVEQKDTTPAPHDGPKPPADQEDKPTKNDDPTKLKAADATDNAPRSELPAKTAGDDAAKK